MGAPSRRRAPVELLGELEVVDGVDQRESTYGMPGLVALQMSHEVPSRVGPRRVADIIVQQARKLRADAIVIGTHGRRGISRMVMGSDAEEVVRTSPIPVVLVRGKK